MEPSWTNNQTKCKLCDLECYMFDVFRKTCYDRECNCMNYSVDDKLQPESCHLCRSSRNLTIPECVPRKDTVYGDVKSPGPRSAGNLGLLNWLVLVMCTMLVYGLGLAIA